MNEIRERVRRLVAAMPKMTTTQYVDESCSLIADLLAELERMAKDTKELRAHIQDLHECHTQTIGAYQDAEAKHIQRLIDLKQRIAELESWNAKIKKAVPHVAYCGKHGYFTEHEEGDGCPVCELEAGEDVYRCVKCGGIYLDSPVTTCDCAHDATEFRLCKLVDPKLQEAPK